MSDEVIIWFWKDYRGEPHRIQQNESEWYIPRSYDISRTTEYEYRVVFMMEEKVFPKGMEVGEYFSELQSFLKNVKRKKKLEML